MQYHLITICVMTECIFYRYERTACYRNLVIKEGSDYVSRAINEDDSKNRWCERREWIGKLHLFTVQVFSSITMCYWFDIFSPIHTATFAYLSIFYTCVYLLRCAILVVWTQLLICKSCTREQICTWSGLGANLLLLICCSKLFACVCKCGRMNAQQIYLYMYFTKAPFIRRKFAYVCNFAHE